MAFAQEIGFAGAVDREGGSALLSQEVARLRQLLRTLIPADQTLNCFTPGIESIVLRGMLGPAEMPCS